MREFTYLEVGSWLEAFASCAIEGNQVAKEMLDLWNSGQRAEFLKRLEVLDRVDRLGEENSE